MSGGASKAVLGPKLCSFRASRSDGHFSGRKESVGHYAQRDSRRARLMNMTRRHFNVNEGSGVTSLRRESHALIKEDERFKNLNPQVDMLYIGV